MRGKSVLLTVMLVAACGCGESVGRPVPVGLDQVPVEVKAAATKALPQIKFDKVQKIKVNGQEVYEVRGKDKNGKIREVEVSATGEVLDIE